MKKKWLAMVLALVFVVLTAACNAQPGAENGGAKPKPGKKEEQEKLVVCVESQGFMDKTEFQSRIYSDTLYDCDIIFEVLPSEGSNRQAACDRIRVELMSGEGPDVFVLGSGGVEENLFPTIEKTMRGGYFLPLDEYIENWETDLFEKQTKVIMDAGKTEEGQVVLPLLFTLPVFVVAENEMIDNEGPFKNLESLEAAAERDAVVAQILNEQQFIWFPAYFAKLGDYDAEKITLTQDELQTALQHVKDMKVQESLYSDYLEGAVPGEIIEIDAENTQQIQLSAGLDFDQGMQELAVYEDRSALAVYNTEGGLTAMITAYAVVNRNTQHPEDAVKAASVLYKDLFQNPRKSYYFGDCCLAAVSSVPVSEAYTYYEQLKPYLDQVNAVRFYSEMDGMLGRLTFIVQDEDPAELAEDELSKMKMIMAE